MHPSPRAPWAPPWLARVCTAQLHLLSFANGHLFKPSAERRAAQGAERAQAPSQENWTKVHRGAPTPTHIHSVQSSAVTPPSLDSISNMWMASQLSHKPAFSCLLYAFFLVSKHKSRLNERCPGGDLNGPCCLSTAERFFHRSGPVSRRSSNYNTGLSLLVVPLNITLHSMSLIRCMCRQILLSTDHQDLFGIS